MYRLTPKFSIRNSVLLIIVILFSLMLMRTGATEASNSARPSSPPSLPSQESVTVHAAQHGRPWINLQDGHEPQVLYKGTASAMFSAAAGANSSLRPTSLASADFNGDGFPDLLVGYSSNGVGALSLYRANPEAFAPSTLETQRAISELRYPSPFLAETSALETSVAPDFIGVGDFNGDGQQDVIIAARGGNALGLLAGDGHANFKRLATLELPGTVTTLMADRGALWKNSSDVAVGIQSTEGPQLLVYSGSKGAWQAEPEVYNLPAQATGLAGGVIGNRLTPDIVAAAGNQLLIVHRADGEGQASRIENVSLPFNAQAAQIGQFVWDREGLQEIALLSTDGSVHLMTPGALDRRPFSPDEISWMKQNRPQHGADAEAQKRFQALRASLVQRPAGSQKWLDAETLNVGALPASEGGSSSQFVTASLSSGATDDLLVVDQFNNQVRAVLGIQSETVIDIEKRAMRPATVNERPDAVALDVEGAPVAVLPMKLNLGTRNGMVILREGATAPSFVIAPAAVTINVTTTADVLANNGQCSLREAIINANQNNQSGSTDCAAGSPPTQISLPAGTYTLALSSGPFNGGANTGKTFDDEFQLTNGFIEQGGDLDIGNHDLTINGTGAPIIQAGTTAATTPTNGNGIDRVIDVNNPLTNGENLGAPINITLSGLTIRNGKAPENFPNNNPANNPFFEAGGGIQYDADDANGNPVGTTKTLTLTNVTMTNNLAAGEGGGILSNAGSSSAGALAISGGGVNNNISYHTKGGGMRYDGGGAATPARTLSISNATINGNSTLYNPLSNFPSNASFGGGINAVGGTGISISGTTISGNNADWLGGGLDIDSAPNVTVTGGSITNNISKGEGGGVWSAARNVATNSVSTITLNGVSITGNQALGTAQSSTVNPFTSSGNGGGIFNQYGNMSVTNGSGTPHIDGNTAGGNGGGVFNAWTLNSGQPSAGFSMTSGTIGQTGAGNGNSAKNNGGGFALNPGAATTFGTVSLTSTTITNNTANSDSTGGGDGGGIFVGSGNLNPLSGVTIDSNVANSGTGDGIAQTGGTLNGAGTINVNGGDSVVISGGTFTSTSGTLNISGNLSISGGTFNASTGTTNLTGNFSLTSGTFTGSSAPVNVGGNFTFSGGTFTAGTGTFTFNGSAAQTIGGTSSATFNNLIINNANGVTLGTNETVGAALTLTNGALAVGSNTLTLNGAATATGGSLTSNANGTVNYNQGSAGQAILAANYGNLTFSNFAKTLPNGGTVQIRGTFTTGAGGGHTVTGSTVEFNGTSAQTLPAGFTTYNNLTLNNPAGVTGFAGLTVNGLLRVQQGTFTSSSTYKDVQIDSGATLAGVNATTINVNGNWTNNGTFTANGNTVNFNGSAAQTIGGTSVGTFNNLTINNAAGVNISNDEIVNGTLTLTNGALGDAASILTLNSTVAFTSGTISSTAGTVIYNQGSNGQTVVPGSYFNLTFSNFNKTLASTGTIGIAGTFTPGTATGHTITGSTINFNGSGPQTIPAFTYNNLTSSSTGFRTLAPSGIVKIAGTFTPGTNAYTTTGSTVEYNGTSAQTLPAGFTTYNNLTLNNTAGTTGFAGLTVLGLIEVKAGTFTSSSTYNNVQIDSGATLAASAGSTINVSGSWTNNGTFTPGTGTVSFNGAATQTIGGTSVTTFNNLTNSNSVGLTLGLNSTVNGALALTSSDLNTGAFTLTMPATGTSSGTFDAIGNVKRTGFVSGGSANTLSFGNPNNFIRINTGTPPTDITVNLVKAVPSGAIGFPTAVQRTYTITPNGGTGYSATLRLHYLDSELNGNTEAGLILRRFNGVGWSPVIPTAADTTANWLEASGVTQFSPWTFNSTVPPTASSGSISGRVTSSDGASLGGVIVELGGSASARTITAADGSYRFDNVEVNSFYTVTPQRANYSFSPVNRTFSLLADKTDAVFTATPDATQTGNPLETDMFFVRQQYLDFLGREPDAGGLDYWTSEIDKCGADANCLRERRIGIAAAFFIEQEYQQTGSFVYRVYKGALGRQLSFAEFSADRPAVLGGDNLEANKTAFADAFVKRAEFVQKYNQANGAESFVDALLNSIRQTSGADLSDQRGLLIARYNNGSDVNHSRSLVLREAIDHPSFKQAEYNPSFVLMEYFGYLKRDPEQAGYDFWLNVLNNREPNNYRGMVCSFITSAEYQTRFSSVLARSNQDCR